MRLRSERSNCEWASIGAKQLVRRPARVGPRHPTNARSARLRRVEDCFAAVMASRSIRCWPCVRPCQRARASAWSRSTALSSSGSVSLTRRNVSRTRVPVSMPTLRQSSCVIVTNQARGVHGLSVRRATSIPLIIASTVVVALTPHDATSVAGTMRNRGRSGSLRATLPLISIASHLSIDNLPVLPLQSSRQFIILG